MSRAEDAIEERFDCYYDPNDFLKVEDPNSSHWVTRVNPRMNFDVVEEGFRATAVLYYEEVEKLSIVLQYWLEVNKRVE